jgi:thiamine-monophosphate kinase
LLRGIDTESAKQLALHGGDDYELLFTVSPRKSASFSGKFRELRLTQIGKITTGRGVRVIGLNGRLELLCAAGWDPFRRKK